MLASYHGIVKKGQIQLQEQVKLPEGAEVLIVVAPSLPEIEAQQRRLVALSDEEWQRPFEAFAQSAQEEQPEESIDSLSDEELVELVHQVREERRQQT
jgi:hypothetical protein